MPPERPFLPIIRPTLGEEEVLAVRRVVQSGWVTQGPEVEAFENEFAAWVGASSAVAVSNCTAALHLALHAVGVGPGDEVITASHSFIATANSIRYCGATPVFVDIDPTTLNIRPDLVERAISAKTKAILVVHQIGMPADLGAIVPLASRRGIPVVEDAACAAGSEILWEGSYQRIGRPHGAVACFSLHPRKLLTTGDGGMITTNDKAMEQTLRRLRQHGMSTSDRSRHLASAVVFEEYPFLGYNYRLTDLQAAIGRVQLGRLADLVSGRRVIARWYEEELARSSCGAEPIREPAGVRTNWQSYAVRLPHRAAQRDVMQALLDRGIASRRGIMCAHREQAYPSGTYREGSPLTESERAQDEIVLLPLFVDMTRDDVRRVISSLEAACNQA